MKKVQINEKKLLRWINLFREKNGNTPGLRDLYRYKGCPYSKETILKEYGNLSNLYDKFNIPRKSNGYNGISDEDLLIALKHYVIAFRTTDRDKLRSHGCYDREVYESRFGSWSKALEIAGIDNSFKTLMKYFKNYRGEEPIDFLKRVIGAKGDFTERQKDVIEKAKGLSYDTKAIRNSINYKVIKDTFKTVSILLVACGQNPTVNYCSGNAYVAKDGHICDSEPEVLIDDFLSDNNISHEIHVKYPGSDMVCDFKVNDTYIEYAGLMEYKKYQDKINRKIEYAKEHGIKQIILFKKDLNELSDVQAALTGDC